MPPATDLLIVFVPLIIALVLMFVLFIRPVQGKMKPPPEVTSAWDGNPADVLAEMTGKPVDPRVREFLNQPYRRGMTVEQIHRDYPIYAVSPEIRSNFYFVDERERTNDEMAIMPPNIGGEGNPPYAGPHYESVHGPETRFVPYDVCREVEPGKAVHYAPVAGLAVFGPIDRTVMLNDIMPHYFETRKLADRMDDDDLAQIDGDQS